MKYLKNIKPYEAVNISLMINHTGNKIASKALIDSEGSIIAEFKKKMIEREAQTAEIEN